LTLGKGDDEIKLYNIPIGRMLRSGSLDFKDNPINTVLTGPIGTREGGWPSGRRGTGAMPPAHLDMDEQVKPIEQHGFTIADLHPDKIVLRMFKWDRKTQTVEDIDKLEPYHRAEFDPRQLELVGSVSQSERVCSDRE